MRYKITGCSENQANSFKKTLWVLHESKCLNSCSICTTTNNNNNKNSENLQMLPFPKRNYKKAKLKGPFLLKSFRKFRENICFRERLFSRKILVKQEKMPTAAKNFVIKFFAKLGESKFIFVEIKMFERLMRIICAKIHETSSKFGKVRFFARMEKAFSF